MAVVGEIEEVAKPAGRRWLAWLLGAACVVAAGVTGWLLFLRPAPGTREAVLTVLPVTSYPGDETFPGFSPDGSQIAFAWRREDSDNHDIYVKVVSSGEPLQLTRGPEEDVAPAWSPDGQTVAFVRVRAAGPADLYLVPAGGGKPRRLTFDDSYISGLAWTADGREVVFSSRDNLWTVSKSGGNPQLVAGIGGGYLPAIPRRGRRVVFTREERDINIWRVEVPAFGVAPRPPTKLQASTRGDYEPQFSADGRRVAFTSDRSGIMQVWVCDSDSAIPVQLTSFSGPGAELSSWSPDGGHIAFNSSVKGNWDIYVISSHGGAPRQLTAENSVDSAPSWSRDGRWVYFGSNRTVTWQVWEVRVEGGAPVQVTKNGGCRAVESPDGKFVYYTKDRTVSDAWKVPVGGGEEVPVLENLESRWAITEKGLYFLGPAKDAAPGGKWFIQFFDFATKQVTPVVALEKEPYPEPPAVSPDGQTFLYTQVDTGETDLMLVENFR